MDGFQHIRLESPEELGCQSRLTRTGQFTLIELIVVMGIIGVMMYVGAPAFNKLLKGNGKTYTAMALSSKIGMTRCTAINTRQYTALVFYQADEPAGGDVPVNSTKSTYFNRAYRMCIVLKISSDPTINDYYFLKWVPGESWEFTQDGVIVLELNDQPEINLSGGLIDPDNSAGTFDKIFFNYDAALADSATDYTPGVIFAPSGKPVPIGSRYIKIGEGVYSGTALVITERSSKAYATITVDQYTGRITYGTQ